MSRNVRRAICNLLLLGGHVSLCDLERVYVAQPENVLDCISVVSIHPDAPFPRFSELRLVTKIVRS